MDKLHHRAITIIGSTSFSGPSSKRDALVCAALGRRLAHLHVQQGDTVLHLRTGGVGGPPAAITNAYLQHLHALDVKNAEQLVSHHLPQGGRLSEDILGGQLKPLGNTMEERRILLMKFPAACVLTIQVSI